jgi:hypothetical protein
MKQYFHNCKENSLDLENTHAALVIRGFDYLKTRKLGKRANNGVKNTVLAQYMQDLVVLVSVDSKFL